jgi:hypothetical protein
MQGAGHSGTLWALTSSIILEIMEERQHKELNFIPRTLTAPDAIGRVKLLSMTPPYGSYVWALCLCDADYPYATVCATRMGTSDTRYRRSIQPPQMFLVWHSSLVLLH